MGFTAATGEPVLCVVIFKSENEQSIPLSWVSGLDITKLFCKDNEEDNDNIRSMTGKGKVYPFGPECVFRGKVVPCLTEWSKHGGINSTILTNCLRHTDALDLFERSNNLKPFVLLDGHSSRFDLEVVNYIRDEEHPWSVCIGLPYGTHIWQVGDSPQQNQCFKFHQKIMKDIIMREKKTNGIPAVFAPTDIIPIINYAWDRSFARCESNKTAIVERGWNPLNYSLLTDPEVIRTKEDGTVNAKINNMVFPSCYTEGYQPREVNLETGTAAIVIDAIVQSSLDRIKRRNMTSQKNIELLNRTKKLTLGVAFHRGCVGLHTDPVYSNLFDHADQKKNTIREKRKKDKKAFKELTIDRQGTKLNFRTPDGHVSSIIKKSHNEFIRYINLTAICLMY
jgi:hypothetical protein